MPLPKAVVEAGARALFLAPYTGDNPKVVPNTPSEWQFLLDGVRDGTLPEDELDWYFRNARICFAVMLRATATEHVPLCISPYVRAELGFLADLAEDAE